MQPLSHLQPAVAKSLDAWHAMIEHKDFGALHTITLPCPNDQLASGDGRDAPPRVPGCRTRGYSNAGRCPGRC